MMDIVRPQKIYLLRHGAVQGVDRKTYIGQIDLPLSPEGIDQAKAWHDFFQNSLPDNIFCSDLKRSLLTANIIADPFLDRICIEKSFREISLGRWDGVLMEDIRKKYPRQWERRGNNLKEFRPPEGESFSDLSERVVPTFYRICEDTPNDMIIVAHAGVNRVILAELMGIDLNRIFEIPQDYSTAHLIEITRTESKTVHVDHLSRIFSGQ
jgi:broad specificity phosphatase PhoE